MGEERKKMKVKNISSHSLDVRRREEWRLRFLSPFSILHEVSIWRKMFVTKGSSCYETLWMRKKEVEKRERERRRDSTWLNRFNIIRIIWDDDHLYPILSSLFLVLLLLSSFLYSYCIHLHVSEHCRAYYLVPSWCGSKGDREEEVNEWVNDRMRVVRVSAAAGRKEERKKRRKKERMNEWKKEERKKEEKG